jgi:hypothetical protein
MKKNILLICICLIISNLAIAQKTKKKVKNVDELPKKAYILKFHPIGAIYTASPNIGIDYVLGEKGSVQFELGYKLKGQKNYVDAPYQFIDNTVDPNSLNVLKNLTANNIKVKSGIDLRLGYKYYIENWSKSMYLMPQLRYSTIQNTLNVTTNPSGDTYMSDFKKSSVAAAFMFGYQGFYKDRFCYDFYLGPGREQFTETFTFAGGIKPDTQWEDNHKEVFDGQFNWKFHVGFMVGYRFGKGKLPNQIVNKNGTGLLD